jgi:hypothetical protein
MAISPGRWAFRPLTRCHRPWPGCQAPTSPRAGGHGQVGAASRFHRTLPAVGPAGHGLDGADDPKGATPGAPSVALRSAGSQLRSKGRASEADQPGRRCSARGRSRRRVVLNGPVRGLGAISMTRNGNQVRVLDPVHGRPTELRTRRPAFRWSKPWWAWLDLNQRPHPYQLNAGNRCAHRPFRRSCPTVEVEGMRSISPLVCVLPRRLRTGRDATAAKRHGGPQWSWVS